MHRKIIGAAIGFALAGAATSANAGTIPYPNSGTENPITYTFMATNTGPITAYFAGSTAAFTEEITLLVNGVATGIQGLNDHTSTVGDSIVLGNVTAGDTLVFEVVILNPSNVGPWFSDKAMNSDGANHVYSTSAAAGDPQIPGGASIPAGTYVAFEDLPKNNPSDFNYFDDTFVFTNVAVTPGVPEPSTWAMMLLGFLGLGFAFRQPRGKVSFA